MPFFIIIIIICLFVSIVINLSIIIENVFLIVPDSNSNGFGQLNPKQKWFGIWRFLKSIQVRRLLKHGLMIALKLTRNIIVFEGNEMED